MVTPNLNKSLSQAIGIPPIPTNTNVAIANTQPVVVDKKPTDMEKDYDLSRETFTELIKQGEEAIIGIMDVAKQSEHPRAYEVAATLIKSVSEATRELMELHRIRREIENMEGGKGSGVGNNQGINIEQAVFVGSPTEMVRRIRKAREKPVEQKDDKVIEVDSELVDTGQSTGV